MENIKIYDSRRDEIVEMEKVRKTDAEWQKLLSREQYEITTRKRAAYRMVRDKP